MQYVAVACCCLLGFVFLWSLPGKARSEKVYKQFLASAQELAGTSPGVGRLLAAASAAGELLIIVLLAVPSLVTEGCAVAAALLMAYSATLARALRRGVRTPCRCLGSRAEPIRPALLGRNAGLLLAAGLGLIASTVHAPGIEPIPVTVSVLAALVGAVLVVFFEDLTAVVSAGPAERRDAWWLRP
jgi:cation transporter-like permease